ncbi:hypothetical protein Y032_0088g2130 [Ancylostoma ceylanicum]|uniref:Uncharacterized protein n=1 Tax=Ancylostoma ceylanicum TaxID=53326 RepID=A0A016TNG3_9BILA|nr:hypothetical protein Y032_0088g2130 [Ancylostoma ceylanicum]
MAVIRLLFDCYSVVDHERESNLIAIKWQVDDSPRANIVSSNDRCYSPLERRGSVWSSFSAFFPGNTLVCAAVEGQAHLFCWCRAVLIYPAAVEAVLAILQRNGRWLVFERSSFCCCRGGGYYSSASQGAVVCLSWNATRILIG